MPKSSQSLWAQNEIFLLLSHFMQPQIDDDTTLKQLKKLSGWMVFAKDDTLLPVYLEACQQRLVTLEKGSQKKAAKNILECAKNYRSSKEYPELLKLAKKLIENN